MSDFDNNNNKYNDIGREVRDSIFDALNSGDLSGLSNSISKTIATAFDEVGDAFNTAASAGLSDAQKHYREQMATAREVARRYHEEQEEQLRRNKEMRAANIRKPNQQTGAGAARSAAAAGTATAATLTSPGSLFNLTDKFRPVGSIKGPIKIGIGGWALFITLLLFFGSILADELLFGIIFALIFGGLAGLILGSGIHDLVLLRTARKILRVLGERDYCTVDELMTATGNDHDKMLKLIKKILNKGFFQEGYIDKAGSTFMNSKEVYDQYLKTERNRANQASAAAKQPATDAQAAPAQDPISPAAVRLSPEQQAELHVMMNDGQNAIKRLHELNDDIPGEAITAKLYTTEGLLNDIFNRVKEHPEQMKKCHKLMNYHLPTMLKLVEAYAEYDKVTVPGPEILKAKEEIEKTMDVINEAFTELLNRMFQDSVWDVTADAQVLKSMLTQEGLAKDIVVESTEN